jgi:hypothetical protein
MFNKIKFVLVLTIVLFSTMTIISASIVSNVNAAGREGSGYVCNHIPGTGTIGQTKCCASSGTMYCTICDDTSPPSNCGPRTLGKFDSGTVLNQNNGGVLSQNDGSQGSTGTDSSINQEGGNFDQ